MIKTEWTCPEIIILFAVLLAACTDSGQKWSTVHASTDPLDGVRTGHFNTWGPSVPLAGGVTATLGWACYISDEEQPYTDALDGFRLALSPDSMVPDHVVETKQIAGIPRLDIPPLEFEYVFTEYMVGPHRLIDSLRVSRMNDTIFLDGKHWYPKHLIESFDDRMDELLADDGDNLREREFDERMAREYSREVATRIDPVDGWKSADSVKFSFGPELGVAAFDLGESFWAARSDIHFHCPVPQSVHEMNDHVARQRERLDSARTGLRAERDSILAAVEAREARRRAQWEREEAERAQRREEVAAELEKSRRESARLAACHRRGSAMRLSRISSDKPDSASMSVSYGGIKFFHAARPIGKMGHGARWIYTVMVDQPWLDNQKMMDRIDGVIIENERIIEELRDQHRGWCDARADAGEFKDPS